MIATVATLVALQVFQSRPWHPSERVVITDYTVVMALAATAFSLFAATTEGLTVYDLTARRFALPVSRLDGYPTGRVYQALASPDGQTVWLATERGWSRYRPDLRRWDEGSVPGGVNALALDRADPNGGVYLRTGRQWLFLPAAAFAPLPARAPPRNAITALSVEQALREHPAVDAMRALFLTDDRLRGYSITAAAHGVTQGELFLGTNGRGIVAVDPAFMRVEHLLFGLPARRAAAVAGGIGGVWVLAGGEIGNTRRGFAWVDDELREVRWVPEPTPALRFTRARGIALYGTTVWAATDDGLVRFETESGAVRVLGDGEGLPGRAVLSVAATPHGLVAGTLRGLALVRDGGDRAEWIGLTGGDPVYALLGGQDTVWAGLPGGLAALLVDEKQLVVPPSARERAALRTRIVALARRGDTVIAATERALFWREPASGEWRDVPVSPPVSVLAQVTPDSAGLWVAGPDGVAFGSLTGGRWVRLDVGGDLPGAPTGVVAAGRWVWIATENGLVRIERAAVVGR